MAYNTLAQIVARVRKDLRNAVDSDTLVQWANDVQEDLFTLDIPIFETRTTYTTTDGTYSYTLTDIASDIRKVRSVFIDLQNVTSPYSVDYEVKRIKRYKFLRFHTDSTTIYLDDDPDGYEINVVYYKTPTALDDINDTPDIPVRWRRGLYLGMMAMGAEHQLKTPSGNWEIMYQKYTDKISANEKTQNQGASTVEPYSVL